MQPLLVTLGTLSNAYVGAFRIPHSLKARSIIVEFGAAFEYHGCSGVIPESDIEGLIEMGVAEVLPGGSDIDAPPEFIRKRIYK
jgi:hypothetical protein